MRPLVTTHRDFGDLALLPYPRQVDLSNSQVLDSYVGYSSCPDPNLPEQGYLIEISAPSKVTISYRDEPGLFYARATLDQLLGSFSDQRIPVGKIRDWPDNKIRGVMLDVSRNRVPTLETLLHLIDVLASWKINQVQLYFEHVFSYPGHESVWEGCDPYTLDDLRVLAAYSKERFVDLVPNQNMLGHMERWLIHEDYEDLGIILGTGQNAFGLATPASTLDPTNPKSLDLVADLAGQLCEALDSPFFHVGLDEPWDLPAERSSQWRTWLNRISEIECLSERELLVWADMVGHHPELALDLADNITLCDWNYEANFDFSVSAQRYRDLGARSWVCPGTSSWLSVAGRVSNTLENCLHASQSARDFELGGVLTCDWGDFGHHQHLPVSLPGLVAGAAFSWCVSSNSHISPEVVARLIDERYFLRPDCQLGHAVVSMGDLYAKMPFQLPNLSLAVMHLYLPQFPVGTGLTSGLSLNVLDEMQEVVSQALSSANMALVGEGNHGLQISAREISNTARFLELAISDARARLENSNSIESVPKSSRDRLVTMLDHLVEDYKSCWLLRNRPGGLEESSEWLEHLRRCYSTGQASPSWAGPMVERARQKLAN